MHKYREIDRMHSPEELLRMLDQMEAVRSFFYSNAIQIGNHPFIEFCGLMGEYINMCRDTMNAGGDFSQANAHSGIPLMMRDYQIKYLAEKLDCIYGPALREPKNQKIFLSEMGFNLPNTVMRYEQMEPLITKMHGWANFKHLMTIAVENASELQELVAKKESVSEGDDSYENPPQEFLDEQENQEKKI